MCGGGGKRKKEKQEEINMDSVQVKSKVESKVKFFIDLRKDKKVLAKLNSTLVNLIKRIMGESLVLRIFLSMGLTRSQIRM